MDKEKRAKAGCMTDEELRNITNIYKDLTPTNRLLASSVSGLLLASQESEHKDKKAG